MHIKIFTIYVLIPVAIYARHWSYGPFGPLPKGSGPTQNEIDRQRKMDSDIGRCTTLGKDNGAECFPTCMRDSGWDNATIATTTAGFAKDTQKIAICEFHVTEPDRIDYKLSMHRNWTDAQFGNNGATLRQKLMPCELKSLNIWKMSNTSIFPTKVEFTAGGMKYFPCVKNAIVKAQPGFNVTSFLTNFDCMLIS